MVLLLIFALYATPQTAAVPFESWAACEAERPRLILALKESGAVAYALTCVPVVKMEPV
jgi:hypothetical protein